MSNEELQAKRTLTNIYSRVVGWLTPIHRWNPGKKSEWEERKEYKQ